MDAQELRPHESASPPHGGPSTPSGKRGRAAQLEQRPGTSCSGETRHHILGVISPTLGTNTLWSEEAGGFPTSLGVGGAALLE